MSFVFARLVMSLPQVRALWRLAAGCKDSSSGAAVA